MKKTSKLLGIAMVGMMLCGAFLSCKNPSNAADDNGGGGNTVTSNEIVIFDPGAKGFTAPEGTEVVEKDGEKYLKCTPKGYGLSIKVAAVDCSAAKEFITKVYAEKYQEKYQLSINVKDEKYADISTPVTYDIKTEPQEIKSKFAEKNAWNTVSETKIVEVIQPVVQDSANGYKAVEDFTVFVGKVYATK